MLGKFWEAAEDDQPDLFTVLAKAAAEATDDEIEEMVPLRKVLLTWTSACIIMGIILGAAGWARWCAKASRTTAKVKHESQTDDDVLEVPRRTVTVQKPLIVYKTPAGDRAHLTQDCRNTRGRWYKAIEVCRDCAR